MRAICAASIAKRVNWRTCSSENGLLPALLNATSVLRVLMPSLTCTPSIFASSLAACAPCGSATSSEPSRMPPTSASLFGMYRSVTRANAGLSCQ